MNNKIQQNSLIVDQQFAAWSASELDGYTLSLPVPAQHARAQVIAETLFTVKSVSDVSFPPGSFFYIDAALQTVLENHAFSSTPLFVEAREDTLKEISWLDAFFEAHPVRDSTTTIVGIGGGILLNTAAYLAEKTSLDFISVPTTVLAAADSAIGGLVRLNKIDAEQTIKSFYKSVYEPRQIIVDKALLAGLPVNQIEWGLSEVVKHGAYQSMALLHYLASDEFEPLHDHDSLIKAICWTVALKNIAILADPEETGEGGKILRGGHALAEEIEVASNFAISHGQAVAVGVYQDCKDNPDIVPLLDTIYAKLELNKTRL